jgi:hypothetical protein
MPRPRIPISKKIETNSIRIPESGCWIWMSTIHESGYGRVCLGKKPFLAHRASYEEKYGKIPNGLMALHSCDVKSCVNPDHIFVGTQQDNMNDKVRKNRQAKGISHGNAKLTEDQAREIKFSSETSIKLAAKFNYSASMIREIKNGNLWKLLENKV